jgi:hypothetical protein
MSALWKQCQQGSSNEGWAKYIQAAALALGVSSETRFTISLADDTVAGSRFWGQAILRKYIRPVAQRLGIEKRLGWHTYSTEVSGQNSK